VTTRRQHDEETQAMAFEVLELTVGPLLTGVVLVGVATR
jgi:hypothetical protein